MNLFVYGTLRDQGLRDVVAGQPLTSEPATLAGYAVHPVAGGIVPFIVATPGAKAAGLVLFDVPKAAMDRLDLYEGAFGYPRITVEISVAGETVNAGLYLPPPETVAGPGDWSLDTWQKHYAAASIRAAQEVFTRNPLPDAAALRATWHMYGIRAWASQRAQSRKAAADLRYAPNNSDITLEESGPLRGTFFGLQGITIRHRQFDGQLSAPLTREVFRGIDAALVLPYDPLTDRVLLVEQIRMGPALLGDPNPWSLEPVAGMVDATETPRAAALREAKEEAGLTDLRLEDIAEFYPSPGASTDYFYCYLGLTSLPDGQSYTGGLATENEDLRLHPITFDAAMNLAQSGEITAGPLLTMLYWLALHRDRLRA